MRQLPVSQKTNAVSVPSPSVLLHSPDTCSSSSSCSDAMRMRVLAAFAAPRSLQDLSLNKTVISLFLFILPLPAFSRVSALAACHRVTPGIGPVMREELPLALPLRPWGTMACIHRSRNATRSAVHESGATRSLTPSRLLLSTLQISLCRPVHRLPPNAAFFEAIFWSSALQNLATRQPLHVSIGVSSPRVCPHPAQVSCPHCTRHERCSLRCASAASSWPAPKARCARCSRAKS
jgi:hypothetical protein